MALIDCPECGSQVSDRAPTCPHCGVPIALAANAPNATAAAAAPRADAAEQEDANSARAQEAATASPPTSETYASRHESVEPFKLRIAGRPIPIAAILFWGGMVLGMGLKYLFPPAAEAEPELWRRLPWFMIWAGVLWFAVTEFGALMKSKLSRR